MDEMTLGVEEEFLVVDAESGALVPKADVLLPQAQLHIGDEVQPELNLCQIEIGTPVCRSIEEVREHLVRLRSGLATAASEVGTAVAAIGSHPFSSWRVQQIDLRSDRYNRMDDFYQVVARQQVICGCHVHVGIEDPELAIGTMNRVRPWLPALLALSANSPYWQGLDTGYASYRLQVWQRWPTSGMPPQMGSRREFDDLVGSLEAIEAIEDATFVYWYVRPSIRWPTLEFRICDVCLDVDETVAIAGLVRALAWTAATETEQGLDPQLPRQEVLEAAVWRAARYGLDGMLISPRTLTAVPAADVVAELLDHVRPGLEKHGDLEQVTALVARIVARGNGASRQRDAWARYSTEREVMNRLLGETMPSHPRHRITAAAPIDAVGLRRVAT